MVKAAAKANGMVLGHYVAQALNPPSSTSLLSPLPQPNWDRTAITDNVVSITTKFDSSLAKNRQTPFKRDRQSREVKTAQCREWVTQKSKECSTVEEFKTRVSVDLLAFEDSYSSGLRFRSN